MDARLAFCSEGLAIDGQTNSVSVFNIIEEMTVAGAPFVIPKINFYVLLCREQIEPENSNVTTVVQCNNVQLVRNTVPLAFNGKLVSRVSVTVGGLVVPALGSLRFQLLDQDDHPLGEWTIPVHAPPLIVPNPAEDPAHGARA